MEAVGFPDVVAMLVSHLGGLLGVPVSTRVPNPRPVEWIRILRTGGPRDGIVVDQAQVTIEYWAADTVSAADGARLVRAHIGALTGRTVDGVQVQRVVELSGPQDLPDPASGSDRCTWTAQIPVRGVPLP